MPFELVKPYDPALIDAPNSAVAVSAAMAMGGVRFSIRDPNSGRAWPNGEAPDARSFRESNHAAVSTAKQVLSGQTRALST
jgi:hypothetical protein